MNLLIRRRGRYGQTKRGWGKAFFSKALTLILITLAAAGLGVLTVLCFGIRTKAVGESMEPLLYNGQNILIDRVRYLIVSPGRDSVIVFLPNGNTASHHYIKRVVALPGDRVQIMDNELYVNGAMVNTAERTYDKMEDAGIAETEILLAEDEYFVLGDNRNSSEDSRSANIGPVKRDQIVGAAWFKYGGTEGETGFVN